MLDTTDVWLPDELVLGIPELDFQHGELFAELASLKRHCLEINHLPSEPANELLARLREHFATEERLASAASIDFSEHAMKHEEMLLLLTKAFEGAQEGRKEVFGLLRYIDYWFERHISIADRHSYRHLGGLSLPISIVAQHEHSALAVE